MEDWLDEAMEFLFKVTTVLMMVICIVCMVVCFYLFIKSVQKSVRLNQSRVEDKAVKLDKFDYMPIVNDTKHLVDFVVNKQKED